MADSKRRQEFEELFQEHFNSIVRYCLHITGDADESLDIAQTVFIKASLEKNLFSKGFNAKAWLYRVARNETMNHFRALTRKAKLLCGLKAEAARECSINMDNIYLELNQKLDSLPRKFRDILYLRYYEQLSYEELAGITGIPVGTVKSRLSQAKKKLKEVIGNVERKGCIQKT